VTGSTRLGRNVIEIEAEALREVASRLGRDDSFDRAVEALAACRGRVVVTGMGKSGLICRKIAATLASTGTPAHFLHPAEALHGDLGAVTEDDVVLAASNTGTTPEIIKLVEFIRRLGVTLISLVGRPDSVLARESDVALDVSVSREACPLGLAPTASTTAVLAVGDALAMALSEKKGFTSADFAQRHPGGSLGARLLRVADFMHTGDDVPRVAPDTPLADAVGEMSAKGLGLSVLVDEGGQVVGILTDGDLRRALVQAGKTGADILGAPVRDLASLSPKAIAPDLLAVEALRLMEEGKPKPDGKIGRITSLVVLQEDGRLAGVLHLHDLWRLQMF